MAGFKAVQAAVIPRVADGMRSSSVRFHLLPEPEQPDFVRRMRASLDVAAARHPSDVAVFHSYFGHERDDRRIAAQGWTSRIVRTRGPGGSPIDIYYDALDDDVMMTGGTDFGEWFPDDETTEQRCLDDLDQIVDALAQDRLPRDRARSRLSRDAVLALVIASILLGAAMGRVLQRRH